MNTATPVIASLTRRLIALEASRDPSDGRMDDAIRVCEKLRLPLARLAGVAGYRSLMARALAIASVEVPSLASVQIRNNGVIEGFDPIQYQKDAAKDDGAGAVILAKLLGLLFIFIGETLTLNIVSETWPEVSLSGMDAGNGEGS